MLANPFFLFPFSIPGTETNYFIQCHIKQAEKKEVDKNTFYPVKPFRRQPVIINIGVVHIDGRNNSERIYGNCENIGPCRTIAQPKDL